MLKINKVNQYYGQSHTLYNTTITLLKIFHLQIVNFKIFCLVLEVFLEFSKRKNNAKD
ncbi:hypothetical protein ACOL22_10375 [Aliarcobacter butzleri]